MARTTHGAVQAAATDSSDRQQVAKAQDTLTREALSKASKRLYEIKSELDKASKWNDEGEIERLQTEKAEIEEHVRRATRPDGRSRTFHEHKKIRNAVRKSILESIVKLKKQDAQLGLHLELAIRLEDLFYYQPEQDVAWSL